MYLDYGDYPHVYNSRYYNNDLWGAVLGYMHTGDGGSYMHGYDEVHFVAEGEIILKIIWNSINLKRIPCVTEGHYSISSRNGIVFE